MTDAAAPQASSLDVRSSRRFLVVSRQCAWLFSIALFGYPIVGNLISLFQLESRVLSIPFRVAVGVFSLWLIATTKRLRIDGWRRLMLMIWFLYCLRLVHDWVFPELDGADYALQFFIATSVLPAVALLKARAFHQRRYALVAFIIASTGAITSLLTAMFGNAEVQDVTATSGRLSLAALDPVSLGHLATSAILCGFVLWRGARIPAKLCIAVIFLGLLWCLILTGSKGPALALVLCIGLWAVRNGQAWKFAVLALPVLALVLASEGNPLADRLSGSQEDESTVDRLVVLNDSFKQIEGSPFIGSAFVELNSGFYPHNVFVEAGLALGVPGALLFLALMLFGCWRAWKALRGEYALLGLLYFEGLFAAATAGAIFGATLLWITLAMLPRSTPRAGRARRKAFQREMAPLPA